MFKLKSTVIWLTKTDCKLQAAGYLQSVIFDSFLFYSFLWNKLYVTYSMVLTNQDTKNLKLEWVISHLSQ